METRESESAVQPFCAVRARRERNWTCREVRESGGRCCDARMCLSTVPTNTRREDKKDAVSRRESVSRDGLDVSQSEGVGRRRCSDARRPGGEGGISCRVVAV